MTTITVATNNIMSLPPNPQVQATLKAAPDASVVMIQEADLPEFQRALDHLGVHRVTANVPPDRTHSCFVLFDPTVWGHVSTTFHQAYEGEAHISLTRHLAVTVLHHRALDLEFAFISYHAVTKGLDRKRRAMRRAGTRAVRKAIKNQRRQGRPVILGCDQNSMLNLFPTRTLHVRHRIDHLYAWDAPHLRFHRHGHHTVLTASDHDTLVATFGVTTA